MIGFVGKRTTRKLIHSVLLAEKKFQNPASPRHLFLTTKANEDTTECSWWYVRIDLTIRSLRSPRYARDTLPLIVTTHCGFDPTGQMKNGIIIQLEETTVSRSHDSKRFKLSNFNHQYHSLFYGTSQER